MVKVRTEQYFDVSADELWNIIGDFGQMKKWGGDKLKSCTQNGSGIGSERTLIVSTPSGEETIVDKLEDVGLRSYSYSIVRSNLPYKKYHAKMEAVEDGEGCKLIWSSEFEPSGLNEEASIQFTEFMYHRGISLIKSALKNPLVTT